MPSKNVILQTIHDANEKEMLKQTEIQNINLKIAIIRLVELAEIDVTRKELLAQKSRNHGKVSQYMKMFETLVLRL